MQKQSDNGKTLIAECTVGMWDDERRAVTDDRSVRRLESTMSCSRQQGKVAVDRAANYGSAAPDWILHAAEPAANGTDEQLAIYALYAGI